MMSITKRRYRLFCSVFLVAAACVVGCSSSTALTNERLDPLTSVTVRYSEHPLVFYRNVSGRAAYAKDYVDLAPIEVNRGGDFRYFIWLGIWTVDGDASSSATRSGFESIVIFADNQRLRLEVTGWAANTIGASEPVYKKPFSTAVDAYYEVSVDQLRLLAEAAELRLHTGGSDLSTFEPWDNQERGKAALRELVTAPTY